MRWIELIHVRSSNKQRMPDMSAFQVNDSPEGLLEMSMYRDATVETDLAIHLTWETSETATDGSQLAFQLVSALKLFGLVHHSVWIEQERRMAFKRNEDRDQLLI
ncbi:MAG TPA: hypothetical protein VMT62_08305 [Syntrophorhabdaceae bacterium]|nr:hypothetical protein [Syntrophorhabdaceae bacterium]